MNEEQTVLEFFSLEENLPLALIAAEHLDGIRLQHNNRFWELLNQQLEEMISQQTLPWQSEITEDRNSEGTLVGIHLEPLTPQHAFLRPFMEQQLMGNNYRIYYGLMWNDTPEPAQKNLPAIELLRSHIIKAGFKESDSFLAWQWSPWYPRSKDFLIRLSNKQDELLKEAMQPWLTLFQEFGEEFRLANISLSDAPRSAVISIAKLHSKITT